MVEITRFTGNLEAFGKYATGTERTVFDDVTQSDTLDANINTAFLVGWENVGPNDLPSKQDFNAMAFTNGQLHAYLHQKGVPEWDSAQEYFALKSITQELGILYSSLTNNTNKPPAANPSDWVPVGAGGAGSSYDVNQVTHGFVVGDILRLNGATYVKAQADSVTNAEVLGVVSEVAGGADDFTIQVAGRIEGLAGLTAGTPVYLSPTVAGATTTTKPTTIGQVDKPVYIPDTTTTAVLIPFVGEEITAVTGLQEASQSEQEAGTEATVYVSPAKQQFHQSACKAWVNLNGTGTIAIRESFNVLSIVDNGVGDITINFINNMANANYSVSGSGVKGGTPSRGAVILIDTQTVSSVRILTAQNGDNGASPNVLDYSIVCVQIHGDLA